MTFRTRLLLAILGVVGFTTTVSLAVAQRQNGVAYRTLGDELLRNQARAFRRVQQNRDEVAAEMTARLAGSVRLFAALEAQDPEVYKIADDELRLGEFSFFRLFDGEDQLIAPPAGSRFPALRPEPRLRAHGTPAPGSDAVQLGFIEVRRGASAARVYRVVAAPIRNFDQRVGTLLLGQRVTALTGSPGESALPLTHAALWTDGRLVGGDVPEAVREPLRRALDEPAEGEPLLRAGSSRYRYQLTLLNPGSEFPPASLVSLFSMDGFFADQRALRLRIVATGVTAALLAGLLALALSRQLARPIGDLVAATRRISAGDFAHRLAPSPTREFDTLANSFNDMAAELALKERYHSVLQQVADAQVAEELVAGRIKLGGELRDVTVMFCDIRQYTALTVGRRPEAVIELLNDHLGALARVVHGHRGVINQFAGDAIMALFGAPKQYGDDTARAVHCALAMVDERERLNADATTPIHIGIGIASGAMVAGCIGAEHRSDYTVVGSRVNLAARLSGAAAAQQILIDDTTRERLDGAVATEPMPPMALKGFGDDVRAFRVLRSAKL